MSTIEQQADQLADGINDHIVDTSMDTLAALQIGGTPADRAGVFRLIRATLTRAVVLVGERLPDDAVIETDQLRAIIDGAAAELVAEYHAAQRRALTRRGDRLN